MARAIQNRAYDTGCEVSTGITQLWENETGAELEREELGPKKARLLGHLFSKAEPQSVSRKILPLPLWAGSTALT